MSLFTYLVILGRQPDLGLVELESQLGAEAVRPFGRQAALLAKPIEVSQYGGIVRVAQVLYRGPVTDARKLPIDVGQVPVGEGKTPFAISLYGVTGSPREAEAAGLALKKRLKERGSVRLVMPRSGTAVAAAGLKHNQVLEKGFELLVVAHRGEMVVAQTLAVQDVDAYAARDYGRPARSAKVGMLPPKLAQILVNSTHAPMVADPFCGTGVVLQEARLLGRVAWGSDIAEDMVAATRTNQQWLDARHSGLGTWQVAQADARSVELPSDCAVVSEGYLGPNLSAAPSPARLSEIRSEMAELYRAALRNFGAQLPAGAEIALCAPAWRSSKGWVYLGIVDELPDLGYTLKSFAHATTPLLYARGDQVVGRQLLLLRKN